MKDKRSWFYHKVTAQNWIDQSNLCRLSVEEANSVKYSNGNYKFAFLTGLVYDNYNLIDSYIIKLV